MAELPPVVPIFDADKCVQCQTCVNLCLYGALDIDKDNPPRLTGEYCNGCGWRVGYCREQAVKCVLAESGKTVWDGRGLIADWVEEARTRSAETKNHTRKGNNQIWNKKLFRIITRTI